MASFLYKSTTNEGLSFTENDRFQKNMKGLLPPRVHSLKNESIRALVQLRKLPTQLDKYIFLQELQNRNERIFYTILAENITELMPLVYTPSVGEGCVMYSSIFRRPRGMWLSIKDAGNVKNILCNWPEPTVKVIVMTDGERILGLGDLGANGMGIPVGKLILYSACAGINPRHCLPITLDCGTNTQSIREDPLYIGNAIPRVRGKEYDDFISEVMEALDSTFDKPLIQFEDFANINSFRLLDTYRNQYCTFNDDIQGTAAAGVTGLLGAAELLETPLSSHKILFLGAGAAGLGIADLIVKAIQKEGKSIEQARKSCWFVDSKGLVVKTRNDLREEKKRYAHEFAQCSSFADAVETLKPTCIIGVSGQGGAFTKKIVQLMGKNNERPIIFALSNPTSKAECSARQAYEWTNGRAIFASGSPFDPVTLNGKTYWPGQGNNSYIFPGVGLGIVAAKVKHVTEEMFLAAAESLAKQVTDEEKEKGCIYPVLERIREVSTYVAVAVAEEAFRSGQNQVPRPADIVALIKSHMHDASFQLPPVELYSAL